MAELGAGPHRSGDIAAVLKRDVTSLGPMRNQLIAKGMIRSPSHGQPAFTVPSLTSSCSGSCRRTGSAAETFAPGKLRDRRR